MPGMLSAVLCTLLLVQLTHAADTERLTTALPNAEHEIVRVITVTNEPYMRVSTDTSKKGNDRYEGFMADMLAEMAERLEWDYDISLRDDGKYGMYNEHTASWNGMIGDLISDKADLAAAPMFITDMRKSVVEFSNPFSGVSYSMLMRHDVSIDDVSQLISNMTTNVEYGYMSPSTTERSISETQFAPFSYIYAHIASNKDLTVDSIAQGIERVKEGNYVFITDNNTALYLANKDCDIKAVGSFLPQEQGFGLALKKDCPMTPRVNAALKSMQREGLITQLRAKWWGSSLCSGCATQYAFGLSAMLASIFYVLATVIMH